MFYLILCSRILLPNRWMIEPIRGGNISKKQGHFYYIKCSKKVDCGLELKKLLKKDITFSTFPMRNDLFTIYLSEDEAKLIQKSKIKIQKVPKIHKNKSSLNLKNTDQYLVLSTEKCILPYKTSQFGINGQIFHSKDQPEKIFETLRKIPCVRAFEQIPTARLNTRFTRTLAHSEIKDWQNKTIFPFSLRNKFVERGIGGHGQVASIADTGVDHKLCWFHDPEQDVVFEDDTGMDHRKILSYFRYADDKDSKSGHGTFIAGIIAGNAICPNDDDDEKCPGTFYDGVAPNARLIINDVFREGSDLIHWPGNGTDLFILPRYMSSAVQYHGFDFKANSFFTFLIDQVSYVIPQMLLLFAAGDGGSKKGFIPSPGDSKNVLTVGATYSNGISLNQIDPATPIILVIEEKEYIGYCDPFHGTNLMDLTTRKEYLGESLTFNVGEDDKNIYILKSDQNDISQYSKCAAILVFNDNELIGKILRPVIRLPSSFESVISKASEITLKPFENIEPRHILFGEKTLSPASKGGPVNLQRIKPEIVMPGGPVLAPNAGAKKGETCGSDGVRLGEGTSVSAAFATGDILLIRQYLKHGYYPSGEKKRDNIIKTSNHMLRAILTNIAQPIEGSVDDVGFGMPQLDKFIIFQDEYKTNPLYGIRMFTDFLKRKSYHSYQFEPEEDGPMRVTLAWNDPPHDPFAPSDVLFKVDLRVEDNQGSPQRIGNRREEDYPSYDVHNTVKLIDMNVKKGDKYTIYVISGDLLYFDNVSYSLVISGPFHHFNGRAPNRIQNSEPPKCGTNCESGAICQNGWCDCPNDRFGDMCGSQARAMRDKDVREEDPFQPYEWAYYSYSFSDWEQGYSLEIDLSYESNRKIFYMFSINEPPTWEKAHCNSRSCPWITTNGKKITLNFPQWDFIEAGDNLIFAVYSIDPKDMVFQIGFNLKKN